jgi:PQQ-dependent dehydrogenase (s-GDH family)
MQKPLYQSFFLLFFIFISGAIIAQPTNDNCANAISLGTASTCISGVNSLTGQTLSGATADGGAITSSCTAVNSQDVWYQFIAQSLRPTITLSNLGSSWGTTLKIQLLSGSCGSFTQVSCVNNALTLTPSSDLTLGNKYYIRIYKNNTTAPTGSNWGFDICLTGTQTSRMNEVWQRTVLSSGTINTPWEVTYGPDDSLWVTDSHGYKVYKMNTNTGTKRTILDLSQSATDFPAFNVQFNNATQNPWPQGGFAGLAIHPQFNSGKPYVYVSYVRTYSGGSSGPGYFFINSIVRFTYNTSTGKLESPVAICDTLPGSTDHNSQRMIIAPVGGTYYLFYGQGDMGAGQLTNATRPNKAQSMDSYEGKILRFNLEPDADAGTYDKWIPDDNPYNATLGQQSAVWAMGIRNNQGFAYDTTLNILYGSQHGPYSDDEINIIDSGKNYGHPIVIGYADGNYNGSSAGVPNNGSSSLAVITDEVAAAAAIPNYKDPLFSGYAGSQATISNIWTNNPSNQTWPSEAWSGIDFYNNTLIPGWKNSLVICGLKWGRVLRLKLGPAGNTIVNTNGADTVAYFQGKNRYRDLAIDPDGKTLYISDEGTSATGPGGVSPPVTVPNCTNCIIKYTFLGYADANGKSTIPDAIDVSDTSLAESIPVNTVDSATTVTIDATNNMLWVPITGPDGNILAEIYANGNNLGTIHSAFYKNSGSIRVKNSVHYLDRNMTITPQNQPSSTVKIRLYLSKAEFDALDADPLSGITSISDLKILKNSDACGPSMTSATTLINPTFAELHGSNGYVLQGDITSFSSFYFASSNVILPMHLLAFTGSLQNNATLLQWKTVNEINMSHFDIERSINGADFTKIGSETAKGNNNSPNNYSYIDYDAANQNASVVYYRLKIVDVNGSFTYSQIISVTFTSTTTFTVRPNPVQQILYIHGKKDFHKPLQAELYDLSGKVLRKEQEFKNDFSIDVTSLKPGVYILKMYNGSDVEDQVYKVIKQ